MKANMKLWVRAAWVTAGVTGLFVLVLAGRYHVQMADLQERQKKELHGLLQKLPKDVNGRKAEYQRQLEAAWGGGIKAAVKDPQLSISEMLKKAAMAACPRCSAATVEVENFTEFDVFMHVEKPLGKEAAASALQVLMAECGPHIHSVSFVAPGGVPMVIDKTMIDRISDWPSASSAKVVSLISGELGDPDHAKVSATPSPPLTETERNALEQLKSKAEKGEAMAGLSLVERYAKGAGAPKNLVQAWVWSEVAKVSYRQSDIEKGMSAEEVAEAKRLAKGLLEKIARNEAARQKNAKIGLNAVSLDSFQEVDVNAKDARGWTALMQAASDGNVQKVKNILNQGADPNPSDEAGWTSLMLAIYADHEAVAQLLIEKGADINAKSKKGTTALIWAASKGNAALVQRLLDKGAEPAATDSDGKTARNYAEEKGHTAAVQIFDAAPSKETEAHVARGMAFEREGDHDQAIAEFSKAIEIVPKFAAAYLHRGNAYAQKGHYDLAILDCKTALKIEPDFIKAKELLSEVEKRNAQAK